MARFLEKNNKIILGVLLITLCFSIALVSGIGKGEEALASPGPADPNDPFIVAHITDTHFYPLSYLYNGTDETILKSQLLDRKITSEASFWTNLENIAAMDPLPDYLVISGDLTHNGERKAHIDLANGLRSLQNEIRGLGKHNFQVFVVNGNHDLYNESTYDYSSGVAVKVPNVTRKEMSLIYAGLGFPNMYISEAEAFYSADEYSGANSKIPYTQSHNAPNIDIVWNFDPESAATDYVQGDLTYIASAEGQYVNFVGLDIPLSNKDEGHVLGATLTQHTKEFLNANKVESAEAFYIGIAHHSIVEHMAYQEEYITDFIVRDPINVADYLADYGMRYVFTGHVHCADIAHRISFNNNQITDIQTSASLTYSAMVRAATFEGSTLDGNVSTQNMYIQNNMLNEVDVTEAYDQGYIKDSTIALLGLEEYFDITTGGDKKINDFQNMTKNIFIDGILEMVDTYLNPSILGTLKGMLSDVLSGVSILSGLGSKVDELVDVLVDEINNKVLEDYEYKGADPILAENKIFGYLRDMVDKILNFDLEGDISIIDYVMYIYQNYSGGTEVSSLDQVPSEYSAVTDTMRSGEFVEQLFGIILDKEEGLYYLIKGLIETPIDISSVSGMTELVPVLGQMIGYKPTSPLSADNIVLGDLALKFLDSPLGATLGLELDLGDKTIMGFLDAILEDYLTDSLYQGVGEIVSNVVEAFYTDSTFDGNTEKTLILLEEGDTYTYTSLGREDIPTIENGKIPSKLTVTFGEDASTQKRFSWLTDRRVTAGTIQYMEKSSGDFDESKVTEVNGETVIYGTTKGLIDVGLYAQLGYTEKARHTVELTGLKAGTEYLYRVGWPERDYWTEVFSFKTAPGGEDAPFEILLISDPQGFTAEAYERVGNLIGAAGSVFDNGYSFIINAGDLVENSRNTTQYGYYLDVLREYMANTTQVVAAGNHDSYYFEMEDKYLPFVSSASVYLDSYNYMLMNYNFSLPDQDTLTGAYYSYDYSGVHFTILNTNDVTAEGISAEQLEWIKADLAGTAKKHKVVVMHKSLYSAGPHTKDADIIAMRAQLGPVFEENGVNIVISGHDHTYSETFYIDSEGQEVTFANNKTDKVGKKGILYVNIGTVGNKYYKYQESEDVPVYTGAELHDPYLSNPTFGKLTFDGKNLYYQGFEYDAETDTVSEINPPFRLSTLDIILISVGSAVGAGGVGTGIFFLIKFLKKKKLAA